MITFKMNIHLSFNDAIFITSHKNKFTGVTIFILNTDITLVQMMVRNTRYSSN